MSGAPSERVAARSATANCGVKRRPRSGDRMPTSTDERLDGSSAHLDAVTHCTCQLREHSGSRTAAAKGDCRDRGAMVRDGNAAVQLQRSSRLSNNRERCSSGGCAIEMRAPRAKRQHHQVLRENVRTPPCAARHRAGCGWPHVGHATQGRQACERGKSITGLETICDRALAMVLAARSLIDNTLSRSLYAVDLRTFED
jgi:hypothetical protein